MTGISRRAAQAGPDANVPWPARSRVLLRHALRSRTWCALPVTVIDDGDDHAVLRIQAGTDWLAAYGPDGRRAHGWVRSWKLRRIVWRDYDVTYVVPWGRWYGIAVFTQPGSSDVAQWYVNCQDPLLRTAWGFDTMDRELDVVLRAPGTGMPRWKDVSRLLRLVASGALPILQTCRMVTQAGRVRKQLARPEFRAATGRWLTPDPHVPVLDELLAGLPVPPDLRAHAPGGQLRSLRVSDE